VTELSAKQRAFLKKKAHDMEPRLQIGKNGVTDAFVKELETALEREELVKVRVGKHVAEELADEAAAKSRAALVAKLGHTVIYYRAAKEPKLELPDEA
jgi:RNA-binding protein